MQSGDRELLRGNECRDDASRYRCYGSAETQRFTAGFCYGKSGGCESGKSRKHAQFFKTWVKGEIVPGGANEYC
jgi:hypothetical protein